MTCPNTYQSTRLDQIAQTIDQMAQKMTDNSSVEYVYEHGGLALNSHLLCTFVVAAVVVVFVGGMKKTVVPLIEEWVD